MPKKFFYRIEHNEKRVGPYNCFVNDDYASAEGPPRPFFDMVKKYLGIDLSGEYHKTPHEDGLGRFIFWGAARFGFDSIEKLKMWFGDDHKIYSFMELYGFGLYRYEVNERFDSDRQSIALFAGMKKSKKLNWEVLFD